MNEIPQSHNSDSVDKLTFKRRMPYFSELTKAKGSNIVHCDAFLNLKYRRVLNKLENKVYSLSL